MGPPLSRRRVLAALATGVGAWGSAGLLSACTGSPDATVPTPTAPGPPDPLLAVLAERVRLVAQYDAAGRQQPDLLPRLLALRDQTEEQVVALRRALALPEPTPAATANSATTNSATPDSAGTGAADPTGSAGTGDPVDPSGTSDPETPVEPPVTLESLRMAVRASGVAAAAVCETVSVERAPLMGSLAAAASCHELLLG